MNQSENIGTFNKHRMENKLKKKNDNGPTQLEQTVQPVRETKHYIRFRLTVPIGLTVDEANVCQSLRYPTNFI